MSLQRFLLSGKAPRLEWVLLSTRRHFRMGGRDVPVLVLDERGARVLSPRQRKLRRLGPADELAPGLRPGDLVGHALATLATDPDGGLRVARLGRSEPLVKGLVTDTLRIAGWLRPAPPRPDAARWVDTRAPPRSLLRGLVDLRRELRLDAKAKGLAAGHRRFLVTGSARAEAPPRPAPPSKGKAPTSPAPTGPVRLTGDVVLAPGALLPARAKLRVTGLTGGRPPIAEVVVTLEALGPGCNR